MASGICLSTDLELEKFDQVVSNPNVSPIGRIQCLHICLPPFTVVQSVPRCWDWSKTQSYGSRAIRIVLRNGLIRLAFVKYLFKSWREPNEDGVVV